MAGSDEFGGTKLYILPDGEDEFHSIDEHNVSADRYIFATGQDSCWNVGLSRVRRGAVSFWGFAARSTSLHVIGRFGSSLLSTMRRKSRKDGRPIVLWMRRANVACE